MTKTDTYDQQIEALLGDDPERFEELTGIELPYDEGFHYAAWNESACSETGSIFAVIDECGLYCVTQLKERVEDNRLQLAEPIVKVLQNPDIPTDVDVGVEFTRVQLEAIRDAQRSIRGYFNAT